MPDLGQPLRYSRFLFFGRVSEKFDPSGFARSPQAQQLAGNRGLEKPFYLLYLMVVAHAYFAGAMVVALCIWVCALLAIRMECFNPDGTRKRFPADAVEEDPSEKNIYEQLKNHGDGIYKDLDLFFKISLAVFGGIAFVTLSDPSKVNVKIVRELVEWGLLLQLFAAVFTSIFLLTHKRSIVQRWKYRYPWWHIFLWGDTWGFIAGMAITFYAFFVVGPRLVQLLPVQ